MGKKMSSKITEVNCGGGKGESEWSLEKPGYLDLKRLHENLMSTGKIREDSRQALNHMII